MNLKYIKTVLLFVALPILTFAQNEHSFTISGNVNPSLNGEIVILRRALLPLDKLPGKTFAERSQAILKNLKADSTTVQNGHFTFKGAVSDPVIASLKIGGKLGDAGSSLDFYLTNGNTIIKATDSLMYADVSGNDRAIDYNRLMKDIRVIKKQQFDYLNKQPQGYIVIFGKHTEKTDSPKGREINQRMTDFNDQIMALKWKFIDENPDSYIALVTLTEMGPLNSKTTARFSKMNDKLRQTPLGKEFAAKIAVPNKLPVGATVPEFKAFTPEGKEISLQKFLAKSKYTLIDFWASWCMPCRAENPNVVKAYKVYHDNGLNILSVSIDTKAEDWKKAITADGMPWNHVSDLKGGAGPIPLLYGISSIPSNFLVDQEGKIIAFNLRGSELLQKLGQLMK